MKVSIRFWMKIRSQKQTELFRKHFRRMGIGEGEESEDGTAQSWGHLFSQPLQVSQHCPVTLKDSGQGAVVVSVGVLSRNHQDGRSEPHWGIIAARDQHQPELHGERAGQQPAVVTAGSGLLGGCLPGPLQRLLKITRRYQRSYVPFKVFLVNLELLVFEAIRNG